MPFSDQPQAEDLVSLLRWGKAPLEVRRYAAKGALPLDAADRLRALFVVLDDPDPDIAASARATFGEIPPDAIAGFLAGPDVTEAELEAAATASDDSAVLVRVVQHRNVSDATLTKLARNASGAPQEALIVNQARLLRNPALIEALFDNPGLTADGRRMLNELKEEFFEKATRRKSAVSRPREKSREIDVPFADEGAGEAEGDDDAEEGEEPAEGAAPTGAPEPDTDAARMAGPEELYLRLMSMTVPQRVKLALTGKREERRFLIADGSKMVGLAVLRARGLTPTEIEGFCSMRHLDADIFLKIATTRDWVRRPLIALALVKNPKVPLTISIPLVKRLNQRDLRNIFRDRNLPEAVRVQARKIYMQRRR